MNGELYNLQEVSKKLCSLGIKFAFLGGAILPFLLDDPTLSEIRPTNDVDAIANILTMSEMAKLEDDLRHLGFRNDTTDGAPICRWRFENTILDFMPTAGLPGHPSNRWFPYALETATYKSFERVRIPTVSATAFLATKLIAFNNRGNADYVASHDLEDIITILNGRAAIVEEMESEIQDLKTFVSDAFKSLSTNEHFHNALPGHLPPLDSNPTRVTLILQRMGQIAEVV